MPQHARSIDLSPGSATAALSERTEAEAIADFALGLDLAAVPPAVVELAKEHLLDAMGIALASSTWDFGRAVLHGVRELGEGSHATAIGSGARLPPASAALVNGVLAHGLDFDDTHIGAIYHASAHAMAACLAAGEANHVSGRELLSAFIVALEVGCGIAMVGAGAFHERGFHPTAVCGAFACAAGAGRLAGANRQALVWALGLCGSQAAGILEQNGSWIKRFGPGWAAHSALSAVALGRAGFIGPATVLEGSRGLYATHLQTIPKADAGPSHALGATWLTPGIALKPYPCCHYIHAFADAALELRDQFAPQDVERVECLLKLSLHKGVAEPRDRRIRPRTAYEALFSVPFVVALALVRGRVDLAAFHNEPLDAPDLMAMTERTFVLDDPRSDYPRHFPGEVIVYLRDGRTLRCRKSASYGSPDLPMSRDAVVAKFIANAARAIDKARATRLAECVLRVEDAISLDEIMELCRRTPS
ncbi:MmgE/PrpD family protein [Lichenicoccus sp.]|uniref:MmgE/PrpD family protein n=1 Tax=Lichenicoccus sp. TaxID=2781899 RepID=UPI003D0E5823